MVVLGSTGDITPVCNLADILSEVGYNITIATNHDLIKHVNKRHETIALSLASSITMNMTINAMKW